VCFYFHGKTFVTTDAYFPLTRYIIIVANNNVVRTTELLLNVNFIEVINKILLIYTPCSIYFLILTKEHRIEAAKSLAIYHCRVHHHLEITIGLPYFQRSHKMACTAVESCKSMSTSFFFIPLLLCTSPGGGTGTKLFFLNDEDFSSSNLYYISLYSMLLDIDLQFAAGLIPIDNVQKSKEILLIAFRCTDSEFGNSSSQECMFS
jgi:hypothetical protein